MHYTEYSGLFGTRASISFDIAYVLLLAMIPVLTWSLELLFLKKKYSLHKQVMLLLTIAFAVATGLFFFDFLSNGWKHRAAATVEDIPAITYMTLTIHLVFWAVTAGIWIVLLIQSLRKFPKPPEPNDFGPYYVFWLILLALQFFLTTLTGWEFYMLAFCF